MTADRSSAPTAPAALPRSAAESRFVNAMRLSARQWLAVAGILAVVLPGTPRLWKRLERFQTGPDYRIPYALSQDYWLYERRLEGLGPSNVVLLGDSVIWGEYVRPDGTLSHWLDAQSGRPGRFVNGGVNGLFPLALEGLIRHYGRPLRDRKVLLHCNPLWLTSPKADLSTTKEEHFNHAALVPQFWPRIPCYQADLNRRLAACVERHFPFAQWANHLQTAYFEQNSIPAWTLAEDNADPPRHPNAHKNPLAQITLTVPVAPVPDPERGPGSPRHRPWSDSGQGTTRFDWVGLDRSLQWAACQRLVQLLQARGNDVLVVIGPFNEHMLAEDQRADYRRLRDGMAVWMAKQRLPHVILDPLPAPLYADASHPLTEGYQRLAEELSRHPIVQAWLSSSQPRPEPTAGNGR